MVRPPPNPLLSARLTDVRDYPRKLHKKHPKGCFFISYFFSAAWATSSTVSGCTHLPKTWDSMPGIYPRSR